jgi:uncharacterized protein with ParB-like and HNH nuclease domain
MNTTRRDTLKSFLTNQNTFQIIIPEIQRDYVWKEDNVIKLLQSIRENAERANNLTQGVTDDLLNQLAPSIRESVVREMEKKKNYCNVGFIYAYHDRELDGRFILIDGQQRITTLYLILLCLSVKESKSEYFKRYYFKDRVPKIDYKVRDEAHAFMVNFIEYLLQGNDYSNVKDQYWYYSECANDVTIQSILNNYDTIRNYIASNELSLQYVEDNIEFWYFDTNQSMQGEELYIYMNSRGESVSPSESIKAELLKGKTGQEKHDWGEEWEKWQDLFWKNNKNYQSADDGIEEFLRWIKIIETIKRKTASIASQTTSLRKIRDDKKIGIQDITFERIESYYTALLTVLRYKESGKFKKEWLWGQFENIRPGVPRTSPTQIDVVDYLQLLPMLMYAERYPECLEEDFLRFARFFYNVRFFDTISKNPYASLINVVVLIESFLNDNHTDVVNLVNYRTNGSFANILTDEEVIKLSIYKEQIDNDVRKDIEKAFWNVEDYKFCDRKVEFIWQCIGFVPSLDNLESFNLDKFKTYFDNLKALFNSPDDLLRRALLTKGDYSVWDGNTTSLNGSRHSFIAEEWRWRNQFSDTYRRNIFKQLIIQFSQLKISHPDSNRNKLLETIISAYLNSNPAKNWVYYFIKEPSVLGYCGNKFVCFSNGTEMIDDIYLLQEKNAVKYNFCKLRSKVTIEPTVPAQSDVQA